MGINFEISENVVKKLEVIKRVNIILETRVVIKKLSLFLL